MSNQNDAVLCENRVQVSVLYTLPRDQKKKKKPPSSGALLLFGNEQRLNC